MPNALVTLLTQRLEELEKQVAVLMSWHKVHTTLLSMILAACAVLIFKR